VTENHARVSLRRTGGLAGLAMQGTVDTRDLPQPQAAEVLGGIDHALLENSPASQGPTGSADRFQYELTIQRGGTTHVATFSEDQIPAQLAPVIRTLMENATPTRARREP
jgi:hypothetical protein